MVKKSKDKLTIYGKTIQIYVEFDKFIPRLEKRYGVYIKYNIDDIYPNTITKVKKVKKK